MKWLLGPMLAVAGLLVAIGTCDAGPVFSDRFVIDARLPEIDVPPEGALFSAVFPNDPNLKSADVFLTEPGQPGVASDLLRFRVTRIIDGMGNVLAMRTVVTFTSRDQPLPDPLPPDTFATTETGTLQDFTNRPDIFGAKLPFMLAVSSGLPNQPSIEPSDRIVIDARLAELEDVDEETFFSAIYPNNPNLMSADVFLTEPGNPMMASDLVSLLVERILDAQNNIIGMQVTLGLLSEDMPLPPGANAIPETGALQRLTDLNGIWGDRLPFEAAVASGINVPEPAAWMLLGLGGLGVLASARRRRLERTAHVQDRADLS